MSTTLRSGVGQQADAHRDPLGRPERERRRGDAALGEEVLPDPELVKPGGLDGAGDGTQPLGRHDGGEGESESESHAPIMPPSADDVRLAPSVLGDQRTADHLVRRRLRDRLDGDQVEVDVARAAPWRARSPRRCRRRRADPARCRRPRRRAPGRPRTA